MSGVVVLNACGDPTNLKATVPTFVDTLSVFALSGTPPAYPSGLSLAGRQVVAVTGFANFDVAFDIDAAGNGLIYPVKLVVNTIGPSRPVGMLRVPVPFEAVAEAPKTGYQTDSAFVLVPGETVVIQSAHNFSQDICQFALSPYIYAKITIDSVSLPSRLLHLRMGLDLNCGFRSFATGVPTS
jgi:hypothetical protein